MRSARPWSAQGEYSRTIDAYEDNGWRKPTATAPVGDVYAGDVPFMSYYGGGRTMKKKWRPMAGYEGLYEVSNLGSVRSLDRIVKSKATVLRSRGQAAQTGLVTVVTSMSL